MDPADVHDLVGKLHRGRKRPLGSCQCESCSAGRAKPSPLLVALTEGMRRAAGKGEDFVLNRAYVPLVLAALEGRG